MRWRAGLFAAALGLILTAGAPSEGAGALDFPNDTRMTLTLEEAPLVQVLRLICDQAGVSLVAADIEGTVTTRLIDVTLEDAFLQLVVSEGLRFRQDGPIVTVWREDGG